MQPPEKGVQKVAQSISGLTNMESLLQNLIRKSSTRLLFLTNLFKLLANESQPCLRNSPRRMHLSSLCKSNLGNWRSSTLCSMEPSTIYRTIHTSFSCPSRKTRPIAWLSINGFHCGSRKWTRLAIDRSFKLTPGKKRHLKIELVEYSPNCACSKSH